MSFSGQVIPGVTRCPVVIKVVVVVVVEGKGRSAQAVSLAVAGVLERDIGALCE